MSLTSPSPVLSQRESRLAWMFGMLLTILTLHVLGQILINYVDYFPPNFDAGFLIGREAYFHGIYSLAFYIHILVGPAALLSAIALIHTAFRRRFRLLHYWVGRIQAINAVILLAPTGAVMALYAYGGPISTVAFLFLSALTAVSAVASVYHAMAGNFSRHRVWAIRNLICIASPVVLRLMSGAFIVLGIESEYTYRFVAWSSWLVPSIIYETHRILTRR